MKPLKRLLAILPSHGHGGCEYNALSALRYFRDQHALEIVASFPILSETEYLSELCTINDIAVAPFDGQFDANDTAIRTTTHRQATWALVDSVKPSTVFIPMPWPKRGQGVIAGCADSGIPTVVKFALVPTEYGEQDFVMPEARAAIQRRQVWFANSRFSAELLEKHWNLSPRSVDSFHVGPIGLSHLLARKGPESAEAARKNVRSEFNLPTDCRIAATVARLSTQKGYDTLMQGAPALLQAFPDLVMLWIGHGELQNPIEGWIRENGFDERIKLTGFREDVRSLLKASDFFVLPTVYEGGCSQALLEAMEEELPIVVTNTSAVSEVIRHNENGLLVEVNDVEDLVCSISRLANDAVLARELKVAAKRDADRFSARRSFENTLIRLRRAHSTTGIFPTRDGFSGASPPLMKLSDGEKVSIYPSETGFKSGWYELETAPDGRRFRWMSGDAVVTADILIDVPGIIEVSGYSALDREILSSLRVFVDGREAQTYIRWNEERTHDWTCSWHVEAAPQARKRASIRMVADRAFRPCERDFSSTDTRLLAISVMRIDVRSSACTTRTL